MNQFILFDLDGTLTDPKEGITKSVQYALKEAGIDEPDLDKLEPFIGPPLKDSFIQFYGLSEEQAEQAIKKYRERFEHTGIFENVIYAGIPEMLRKLKARGKRLAVSSSKPGVFVEKILEHFEIKQYFEVIVGSELDGTRAKKEEVVEEALRQLMGGVEVTPEKVAIVGDRKFDIEGGHANNISTIGVTYGYGGMEELKEAKADYIVDSVEGLQSLLLGGKEEIKSEPVFNKIWVIFFPVLVAYYIWQLGSNIGMYATITVGQDPSLSSYLLEYNEAGELLSITGNGMAIASSIAFFLLGIVLVFMSKKDIVGAREKAKAVEGEKNKPISYLCALLATIGMAFGLNLLFELTGITEASVAYQQIKGSREEVTLPLAILSFGIMAPIAEELLFRGILYNRLKKYMKVISAIFFSSLFFGLYHGDAVSGTYAFLMGCLIAYLYERMGNFYIAVAAHMVANSCAYMLTYTRVVTTSFVCWPLCIIFLSVGIGSVFYLVKKKRGLQ